MFWGKKVAWSGSRNGDDAKEFCAGEFDFGGVVHGLVVVDVDEFSGAIEGFAGGDVLGLEGFEVVAVARELELEVALLGEARKCSAERVR